MRNLVFAINMSLDGCCDHTKFYPDEDTMEYFTQLTRDADTFLYGRKTYQLMVPYWPDVAKNPVRAIEKQISNLPRHLTPLRKLLFSHNH